MAMFPFFRDPPIDPTTTYLPHPKIQGMTRIEVPEAGGWLYRFRGGDYSWENIYVPNLSVWTQAMADAIVAAMAKLQPKSVALDTAHATDVKQPRPEV